MWGPHPDFYPCTIRFIFFLYFSFSIITWLPGFEVVTSRETERYEKTLQRLSKDIENTGYSCPRWIYPFYYRRKSTPVSWCLFYGYFYQSAVHILSGRIFSHMEIWIDFRCLANSLVCIWVVSWDLGLGRSRHGPDHGIPHFYYRDPCTDLRNQEESRITLILLPERTPIFECYRRNAEQVHL